MNFYRIRNAITKNQLNLMVAFLEIHPEMLLSKYSDSFTVVDKKKLWAELAVLLNGEGSCKKSVEKWTRTWTDYKCNLKKKAAEVKKNLTRFKSGSSATKKLTDLEKRAIAMIEKAASSEAEIAPDCNGNNDSSVYPDEVCEDVKPDISNLVIQDVGSIASNCKKRKRQLDVDDLVQQQELLIQRSIEQYEKITDAIKLHAEAVKMHAESTKLYAESFKEMSDSFRTLTYTIQEGIEMVLNKKS